MRLAASAVAVALLLGGCSSEDGPQPTATPPPPSASSASTPAIGAGQEAVDAAVERAIRARDTAGLRVALRRAGSADGASAVEQPIHPRDVDPRRNYRIAGWWLGQYADDPQFADLYDDGRQVPYATLVRSSTDLEELQTLADDVQDDWQDATGKRLSLDDTYSAAYDDALHQD